MPEYSQDANIRSSSYALDGQRIEDVGTRELGNDIALIVNPNSCGGLTGRNWDSLFASIKKELGAELEIAFTKRAGQGTELARDFLRRGFKKIAAIGGDGTINEVANGFFEDTAGIFRESRLEDHSTRIECKSNTGTSFPSALKLKLINPDAIMSIIPCGTRNVLAKSLGLPEVVEECCRTFSLGKLRKIDVISATVTNPLDNSMTNTRILLNAVELGAAAEIIDRSKKVREVINSRIISTIAGIVSTLPSYQSNTCKINFEKSEEKNGEFIARMTMAIVANGPFLGGGFRAAPKADMSDGLLDLVILKDSGSFKMLDEIFNMKDGNYSRDDNIFYIHARRVSLRSMERDVTVTIDGEPIGILPATFDVIPSALNISI